MKKMIELNVHKFIGLPDSPNINEFSKVYRRQSNKNYHISPVSIIVALLYTNEDVSSIMFILIFVFNLEMV